MSDLGPFADMEEEGGGSRRILLFAVFGLAGVLLLGALALLGFVVISMLMGGGEPANTPTPLSTATAEVVVVTPRTTPTKAAPTAAPTTAPTATESAAATTPTQASENTPAPTAKSNEPTATPKGGVPDTGAGDVALLIGAGLGLVVLLLLLRGMRTRGRPGMP